MKRSPHPMHITAAKNDDSTPFLMASQTQIHENVHDIRLDVHNDGDHGGENIEMVSFAVPSFSQPLKVSGVEGLLQTLHRRAVAESRPKNEDITMYTLEANPDDFPDGGLRAYLVLAGSFCGLIADFGIPNSLGPLEAYVSNNQLSGAKQSTVSWVFSLHLGVMFFCSIFSGGLFDKYGSRKLLIGGTIFMCGGLLATAELKTMYQFILAFSIVTAFGASLAMAPLIGVLSHWFLRKRGFACSLATIGGLVGSAAFAVMLERLYSDIGYIWAMRVLSLICLGCMSISILLIKDRHTVRTVVTQTSESEEITSVVEPVTKSGWKVDMSNFLDLSPLRNIRFVSLVISVFLSEMIAISVLMYMASYALANDISQSKSYLLITVINISGIPARLATGILADKIGRFNVMLITSFFTAIFIFALLLPARGNLTVLYAFGVVYGCSSSAAVSLIAACLGQITPAATFGKHYGVLYFCLAFLIIIGIFSASLTIQNGTKADYQNWVIFEGCVATAAVFSWLWARYTHVRFRLCKF